MIGLPLSVNSVETSWKNCFWRVHVTASRSFRIYPMMKLLILWIRLSRFCKTAAYSTGKMKEQRCARIWEFLINTECFENQYQSSQDKEKLAIYDEPTLKYYASNDELIKQKIRICE